MAEPSLQSLFTPEMIADPYPIYAQLRQGSPVLELPDANLVILSRYQDIQQLLRSKVQSFGGGIHLCLGAQLARIEAQEALGALFERLPDLELDDPINVDWKQTMTLRGPKQLPAKWAQ